MSEILYDPACMDCRQDSAKDRAGTTWQCNGHVRAERDWLRAKLANVMVEWEHDVKVLTKERNAALTLAEQRGAAYDMAWREEERLRDRLAAAESRAERAERERDAYRHEWNVSSRQQGAETRARKAAEARAARAESLLTDDGPDGQRVTNAQHVALRERLARAEAALREIAGDAFACDCGELVLDDEDRTRTQYTCPGCVARAALAGQEVGRG